MAQPLPGLIVAAFIALGYPWLMLRNVSDMAARRRRAIKMRLPVTVDLITLMMEAGAGFAEAMRTAATEQAGHPIGDELAAVCRDISLGRSRSEALQDMANRLSDDDVSEFVFAVNKGEELGTPLTAIFRIQANQTRLKRSQWLEKASAEAQVNMVFPGMVIMIACLMIVAAPFILPVLGTP
jgi:tight adherence protein C